MTKQLLGKTGIRKANAMRSQRRVPNENLPNANRNNANANHNNNANNNTTNNNVQAAAASQQNRQSENNLAIVLVTFLLYISQWIALRN